MTAESSPLVFCTMPTFDRRNFLPRAITYFKRQDYPNKQLIIVDDGTDSVADLIPSDERIQYIRLPQRAEPGVATITASFNESSLQQTLTLRIIG
jgi:glycosyltransferase involved in cell wall biosynthesis